jgi:esterase/lipase superfamily enzyme
MGAFHAANFYFKRPDVFDAVIALSGIYNAEKALNRKYGIRQIYFNSPLHYLHNLSDPKTIAHYQKGKIVICVGQGAWEDEMIEDTAKLKSILKRRM